MGGIQCVRSGSRNITPSFPVVTALAGRFPARWTGALSMDRTSIVRRIGRGLMVLAFAVTAGLLTSPGTAYAKHGDGAAIALGNYRRCAGWSRHRFLNRASVLRSAALLLLPLCAAGLLCRARTSARCVLCSGAVLRAGILLPRILNAARSGVALAKLSGHGLPQPPCGPRHSA